jgi:hypothetical protein
MGFLAKINSAIDILLKLAVVAIAFAVALLPVAFLLGHEALH